MKYTFSMRGITKVARLYRIVEESNVYIVIALLMEKKNTTKIKSVTSLKQNSCNSNYSL